MTSNNITLKSEDPDPLELPSYLQATTKMANSNFTPLIPQATTQDGKPLPLDLTTSQPIPSLSKSTKTISLSKKAWDLP